MEGSGQTSTQCYMGEGRGLDAVLRNMFQLKICVKRTLVVSHRREVWEFRELIVSRNRNVLKIPSLVSFVSVCLFRNQIVQITKLILLEKACVSFKGTIRLQ